MKRKNWWGEEEDEMEVEIDKVEEIKEVVREK